jgi:sugar phosphate isomerase/epimerase
VGDIDLLGYIRVLHENGYTGPLDLEVIGAKATRAACSAP